MFPSLKIRREVATFKASLNRVVSSKRLGNEVNFTGSIMYIETNKTTTEIIKLKLIKTSSKNDGNGISKTKSMTTAAIGTVKCE